MLSRTQAQRRAEAHARTLTSVPLALTDVYETSYGWVFSFDSKSAVETGDPGEQLLGLGPVLVLARDGTVVQLGTADTLEDELRAYERASGLLGR